MFCKRFIKLTTLQGNTVLIYYREIELMRQETHEGATPYTFIEHSQGRLHSMVSESPECILKLIEEAQTSEYSD